MAPLLYSLISTPALFPHLVLLLSYFFFSFIVPFDRRYFLASKDTKSLRVGERERERESAGDVGSSARWSLPLRVTIRRGRHKADTGLGRRGQSYGLSGTGFWLPCLIEGYCLARRPFLFFSIFIPFRLVSAMPTLATASNNNNIRPDMIILTRDYHNRHLTFSVPRHNDWQLSAGKRVQPLHLLHDNPALLHHPHPL